MCNGKCVTKTTPCNERAPRKIERASRLKGSRRTTVQPAAAGTKAGASATASTALAGPPRRRTPHLQNPSSDSFLQRQPLLDASPVGASPGLEAISGWRLTLSVQRSTLGFRVTFNSAAFNSSTGPSWLFLMPGLSLFSIVCLRPCSPLFALVRPCLPSVLLALRFAVSGALGQEIPFARAPSLRP